MIGAVTADGSEAAPAVKVFITAGVPSFPSVRVETVAGKGFAGHLTLPPATAEALGLPILALKEPF